MDIDENIDVFLQDVDLILDAWGLAASADTNYPNLTSGPSAFVVQFLEGCRLPQGIVSGPDTEWTNSVVAWAAVNDKTIKCKSRELLYLSQVVRARISSELDPECRSELCDRIEKLTYWALEILASNLARTLDKAAHLDKLTGLKNRAGYDRDVDSFCLKKGEISCAVIDMDGLKAINDAEGHEVGDAALKKLASTLSRLSDTHTSVSRWGGDEFAVASMSFTSAGLSAALAELRDLSDVKFSYGIGSHPTDDTSWSKVEKVADSRMYQEKQARKALRQSQQAPVDTANIWSRLLKVFNCHPP